MKKKTRCTIVHPTQLFRLQLTVFVLVLFLSVGARGGPAEDGQWGPVISWPHIPVSAANLPDGRILTWASNERTTFPSDPPLESTYTAVWDPGTNQFQEIFRNGHDMFCAHIAMLEDGRVFVNGGNSAGRVTTSLFDYTNNQWTQVHDMNRRRWYNSTVAIPDGSVFTMIGSNGDKYPEVWVEDVGWRLKNGINFDGPILNYTGHYEQLWWPLIHIAPNGKIFHSGPTPKMHWIDPTAEGSIIEAGPTITGWYPKHGATIMYDEGKIVTAGGATTGNNLASTNKVMVIDLNGPTPQVREIGPMNFRRKFHNGVMLPTGEMLVVGGNTSGEKFSDNGSVFPVEVWHPNTEIWRVGASSAVPRNYHSIALLLVDGRVLSAGGGLCGCAADHQDGQIYSPGYLFNADGSLAVRPTISSAPAAINVDTSFDVTASPGVQKFSLIKMSSTTHAVNTDLRYLNIPFVETSSGEYQLTAHPNPNVLTPGYWMLFAVDQSGTPSVAAVLRVNSTMTEPPEPPTQGVEYEYYEGTWDALPNFDALTPAAIGRVPTFDLTPRLRDDLFAFRYTGRIRIDTAGIYTFSTNSDDGSQLSINDAIIVDNDGLHSLEKKSGTVSLDVGRHDIRVTFFERGGSEVLDVTYSGPGIAEQTIPADVLSGSAPTSESVSYLSDLGWVSVTNGWGPVERDRSNGETGSNDGGPLTLNGITYTKGLGVHALSEIVYALNGQYERFLSFIGLDDETNNPSCGSIRFFVYTDGDLAYQSPVMRADSATELIDVSVVGVSELRLVVDDGGDNINCDHGDWANAHLLSSRELTVHTIQTTPVVNGNEVTYTANVEDTLGEVTYVWNFGDGTSPTTIVGTASTQHTFAGPGRYIVSVTATDEDNGEGRTEFYQAVHEPFSSGQVIASSSMLVDAARDQLWNVNPDNRSVTVFDVITNNKAAEIAIAGAPRSLALANDSTVWVAHNQPAGITVVDLDNLTVVQTIVLPENSRPFGIVFDSANDRAYVTLEWFGQLAVVDGSTRQIASTIDVGPKPRHLSYAGEINAILISRFVTPPLPFEWGTTPDTSTAGAEIVVVNSSTLSEDSTIILQHSTRADSEHSGRGIPNYLGAAVIAPDALSAWVPSKQDNILRGSARDGLELTHDLTVRAIVSYIDLNNNAEIFANRIDLDNSSMASAAAFDKYGNYLFVALEGNRQVAVIDTYSSAELFRFDVGRAPHGLAISTDGLTLYVHNFMDRTVTVHDISALIQDGEFDIVQLDVMDTVTNETLSGSILNGKQLFYDARDTRLTLESYMSCASCHNAGGHDGRVWDFTQFGEGFRNTMSLNGSGEGHGFLHWSGNFDEVQDFEGQIRNFAGGTGLMDDADFNSGTCSDPLGDSKEGISADLDDLAAYVQSLTEFGNSPNRLAGEVGVDAEFGRLVFESNGCAVCHTGREFTDSEDGMLHDIGTINEDTGLAFGVDAPTLAGLWATAPYLHDGSAETLADAVNAHSGATINTTDMEHLIAYLRTIDDTERDAITSPTNHVIDIAVVASTDDAEERGANQRMSLDSTDLELVDDGSTRQTVGLRFVGVDIPQQATILDAYIQFQADETDAGSASLTIQGEDVNDASTFTTTSGNISTRPLTTASVAWSPQDWASVGEQGARQRTPNIAPIIQEIVSRAGWSNGNALAVIISGDGERTAEAFDGKQSGAPRLHVEFMTTPGGDQSPTVAITEPSDGSIFTDEESIAFAANATDPEDGDVSASIVWTSSVPGQSNPIGSGASFSTTLAVGTHIITATATDSLQQTGSEQITVTVNPPGSQGSLDVSVAASTDDAEERGASLRMSLDSTDLELVDDGSTRQTVGLRFVGVDIPQQATILDAYIQFQADETDTGSAFLTIRGEDVNDASTFTTTSGNISARPLTTASVGWSPQDWTSVGEQGSRQRTPNIAPIIQEIVSRAGWSNGNALAIIISGDGERTAEAFDGRQSGAPWLHVDFTVP